MEAHRGKEELGAGGLQFGLQPRGVEFAPLTHPFFVGIVFAESSPVLLDLAAQLVQFGPDALQLRFHLDLLHPQFLETGPQLLATFEPVLVLLLRLLKFGCRHVVLLPPLPGGVAEGEHELGRPGFEGECPVVLGGGSETFRLACSSALALAVISDSAAASSFATSGTRSRRRRSRSMSS